MPLAEPPRAGAGRWTAVTVPDGALVVAVPLGEPPEVLIQIWFEDRRILPVLRRHLHHHVILVQRVVDGRDRALAERVVQRVVDLAGGDAEPRGGRRGRWSPRVSSPACCWSELTSVSAGSCCSAASSFGAHVEHLRGVVGLQRVLIGGVGLPAADADILRRHQDQPPARHARQLAPQPRW